MLKLLRNSKGQSAIEYALVVVLVVLAVIVGLKAIGSNTNTGLNNVATQIQTELPK